MAIDFNLSEAITGFLEDYDSYELDPDLGDPKTSLDEITDVLAVRPSAILDDQIWTPLQNLVQCYRFLPDDVKYQLAYLIGNSLNTEIETETRPALQDGDTEMFENQKMILELYGYLLHALLYDFGKEDADMKKIGNRKHIKKTNTLIENCLVSISHILTLRLFLLFQTTPERNLFIGNLFLNPTNALLENPHRCKIVNIKKHAFKVICLAVKYHGQALHTQNAILQHLTYFPHLSTIMAELLQVMTEHYGYPQLTDIVLKDVSTKKFNENDVTGPKSVSTFLIRLSELCPRVTMRQMPLIAELLDNNSFTLRCAVVEVVGNIISDLAKVQEDYEQHKESANGYIDLLEERLLDINPYVRSRALQGLIKLTGMKMKFVDRRIQWAKLAVQHLQDRSGLVRRNSVKFLSHLIMTHPYASINEERLDRDDWKKKFDLLSDHLKEVRPDFFEDNTEEDDKDDDKKKEEENKAEEEEDNAEVEENEDDRVEEDESGEDKSEEEKVEGNTNTEKENQEHTESSKDDQNTDSPPPDMVQKLILTWQIYKDALVFIEEVERSADICCELLHSKSKLEVIDMMTYFVLLDAYGVSKSSSGIKQMLHLVWMKGSNEEGNRVVDKLIDCYQSLYLNAPPDNTEMQKAAYIAKNLIELTYESSMADLASLEKLIGEIYHKHLLNDKVIASLWGFFKEENAPRECKRGAIIILSMLGLANYQVSLKGLDFILTIGLNPKSDDWILSSFACIALRRAVPAKPDVNFHLQKEPEAIDRLTTILLASTKDGHWYGMAEEALSTIYTISSHPDEVATECLKRKTEEVFGTESSNEDQIVGLAQLIFLVGHICLKTVIYLEKCEGEFKKRKIQAESKKDQQDNELDMIGGTNEDDFSDAVQAIKEKELLYGDKSLLAQFVPVVKEIIQNQEKYPDVHLQRQATLCLCKMMCTSSKFCEDNLQLLLMILQNSKDPIVRSNSVLGLGDMAVCFNSIIDTNKNYLYGRLQDPDLMVQRTCLMTVTFLILAGQVKVKGQLAQMAKLYINPDPTIVDMCKLFFSELATKENAIYNGFMDMFSGLTTDEKLESKDFKEIVKFVVPFIQKDKHRQHLVSKLYQRMMKADNENLWDETAFVIKEIIPRQDATGSSRKDNESAKAKLYNEILDAIEKGYTKPEKK